MAFFYMGERITHGNSLTTPKFLQEPLSTFFTIYMTHLTTLFVFRLLVSEYLSRQILTSVSSHNHRISFFFASRELTLNYVNAFITLYSVTASSLTLWMLLELEPNLLEMLTYSCSASLTNFITEISA